MRSEETARRLSEEMLSGCWVPVLLLLLLLLPTVTEAQSGDGETDMGEKIIQNIFKML